jgi:hypothetical protein
MISIEIQRKNILAAMIEFFYMPIDLQRSMISFSLFSEDRYSNTYGITGAKHIAIDTKIVMPTRLLSYWKSGV